MQNKRNLALASFILVGSLFCSFAFAEENTVQSTHQLENEEGWQENMDSANAEVPISQIRKFIETFQLVKSNYVSAVTDDELFENAIHGLVESLDPYSRYLDAEHYQQLMEFTEGQIAKPHFNLELDKIQQVWRISELSAASEPYRLGLRDGQIIERINKIKLQDLDQKLVNQLMVGSLGSVLRIDFKAEQTAKSVDIVRDQKIQYDVEPFLTDEQILVLKIKAFQKETTEQVQDILKVYQSKSDLKGVLIDLRDNPGGLLSSAVELADLFLEEGLIVSTKGRLEAPQRFQASQSTDPLTYPLAILQNRYSASAAEVFAAALKEQNRAIVIGERSYGKGAIQKLFPLEEGALQMTVAYYYTPQGYLIEGKGIEPNEPLMIAAVHSDEDLLHQAIKTFNQTLILKGNKSITLK